MSEGGVADVMHSFIYILALLDDYPAYLRTA